MISENWIFLKNRKIIYIILGSLGLWLGFPNNFVEFPLLIFLWPICAVLLVQNAASIKEAFFYGWLIYFLGALPALYWLYLPVRNVGGLPVSMAALCACGITACLALQGGCYTIFAKLIKSSSLFAYSVSLALIWFLLDWLFAELFGFPWIQLSGALMIWPFLLQIADFTGCWLGASLWLIPACLLSLALYNYNLCKSNFIKYVAISFTIIAFFCGYGLFKFVKDSQNFLTDVQSVKSAPINAIFIEGNIDQNQKWIPAFQKWNLDIYLSLTESALRETRLINFQPDLIIWPETALPFFFERHNLFRTQIINSVRSFQTPLVFGAPGVDSSKNSFDESNPLKEDLIFNRAFLLDAGGNLRGHYDKMRLVPFGEYLPKWLDWKFLEALLQGVGVYKEGECAKPLITGNLALGMLICYEGIFPYLAQNTTREGANILVDISNDGWFGNSPAAIQHLYLTTGRALEQNRWVLRSTNTGISAVIDNLGRIKMKGPMFQREAILASAQLSKDFTIYNKIYHFILPVVIITTFIFIIFIVKKNKLSHTE